MRTDVKIGLICVVALTLGGVIYFVGRGNAHPQGARASTPSDSKTADKSASPASPAAPASPGLAVVGPSPATPVGLDKQLAAGPAAPGSGMTGQMIAPPGSPSDRIGAPGPATAPASPSAPAMGTTPGVPGLSGGTPMTSSPSSPSSPAGGAPAAGSSSGGLLPRQPASTPSSHETINFGGEPSTASPRPSSPAAPSSSNDTPGRWAGPSTIGGASAGGTTGGPMGTGHTGGTSTPSTHVPPGGTTYTIEKGDMLGPIAAKFGVTVKAIEAANPGINPNNLRVKSTLTIPAATAATPKSTDAHTDSHATASTKPASKPAAHATAGGKSSTIKPGAEYTVKKGDNLGTIAQAAYGDKSLWKRIFRANRGELEDPDVVPVGTVLRIPG
jgi:LysM repeat protein